MIGPLKNRRDIAILTLAFGLVCTGFGVGSVWTDSQRGRAPNVEGPVFENWPERATNAHRIELSSSLDMFALERRDGRWVMPSRLDYPVRANEIAALDGFITSMQFERAMTADLDRFDRLGLGNPLEGGDGVRVSILDQTSLPLASFTLGDTQRDGSGVYLHPAGEARAFAVTGDIHDLMDVSRWLGLDFWTIESGAIARVDIGPEDGLGWQAQRAGLGARNYGLRAPSQWRLITGGAANGVAVAGSQLRFRDVRPRETLSGAVVAHHEGTTFSGLVYRFDFIAEGDDRWAIISTRAVSDDAAERADSLNARTQDWAYLVSDDAYERLTRSLDQIAEPR